VELYLVRHGETEMNRADLFRGRSDPPLNETGLEQARAAGESLACLEFQAFYASPLTRSMRTARAIAERHASEVLPFPAFIDIDYGAWSGLSVEEVRSRWPREFSLWSESPAEAVFPGGESLSGAYARLAEGLAALRDMHAGRVLVVGHKVVNRLVLCVCLGLGPEGMWRLDQSNGAINVVESRGESWMVKRLNDVAHLSSCMSRDQLT
jgi:broad specificity phosphatase PhoE